MKNQTFGVEIETYGNTREAVAKLIAEYFHTEYSVSYQGGSYDTWTAKDNQGRTWKCMKDASILAPISQRCEIVTSILTYSDMNDLQEIIRIVRKNGSKSNAHHCCGIHVHVGLGNHSIKTLKNLVNFFSAYQDIIYKALQIDQDREHSYCKKLEPSLIENFNKRGLDTMEKGETAWYGAGHEYEKNIHYSYSRYHGLNLHSVFSKGTIEFRLFNGTLHAGEIRSYIVFCLAMSNFALNARSIKRNRKNQFNDKYTMYEMLCRIGIKGEESKVVRDHLTKHLAGSLTHEGRYIA